MHSHLDNIDQLLLCCANPFAELDTLQKLLEPALDWDKFLQTGREHRLLPLIHHHFSKLPPSTVPLPVAEAARTAYMGNAVRMEFLTARLDDIQNILKKHNIRAIPWKGPTLARDVYSDAALRPTDDLDFLVHPDDMARAIEILSSEHLVPQIPMSSGTLRRYLAAGHEYILISPDRDLWVELSSNPLPPPFSIRVPPYLLWDEETASSSEFRFLLLCIHGAKHCWDRLIWISDLCAFLEAHPELSLQKLTELARDIHAEALLLSAMELIQSTGFPAPHLDIRSKHVPLEVLTNHAFHSGGISRLEETRRRVGIYSRKTDAVRHVAKWLLAPTFSDWESCDLPSSLSWLYWLLRPARLAATALSGIFKTKRSG